VAVDAWQISFLEQLCHTLNDSASLIFLARENLLECVSGPKKDWPTAFEPVTEEQIQYINEKLISPAYERFVNIVAKSRKDVLTIEQIRVLADGSIYNAPEALENKLIDDIGYMPEAIALAKSLAKITDAKVVEYEKPFSFENFLEAKSIFRIDRDTIYELTTPQLMYLWDAGLKF